MPGEKAVIDREKFVQPEAVNLHQDHGVNSSHFWHMDFAG